MQQVKIMIRYGDCDNGGYRSVDNKYVRSILIDGHTDPKVCHGLSASIYFVAYAIRDVLLKPNDFAFNDEPGATKFVLYKYNRDTEILLRTFVRVVKEMQKYYPKTIMIESWNKL